HMYAVAFPRQDRTVENISLHKHVPVSLRRWVLSANERDRLKLVRGIKSHATVIEVEANEVRLPCARQRWGFHLVIHIVLDLCVVIKEAKLTQPQFTFFRRPCRDRAVIRRCSHLTLHAVVVGKTTHTLSFFPQKKHSPLTSYLWGKR